ncbi:MAG: hypothetical protein JJT89_03570 [Nitriliruptoraceae bacterium]|nr:hypothetical protein [Nitriliruptoraceae bacterium]
MPSPDAVAAARLAWGRMEMIHTLHYFAPDVRAAHGAIGLDDPRMSYVASRSAPLGPVGPEVVLATFYSFAPAFVHAAVPAAWERVQPGEVWTASASGLATTLRTHLADHLDDVVRAGELARELAALHPILARPLAAAWSGVPTHDDPYVALWQALTVMRESRGDGHLACLLDAELDGTQVHLLARGDSPKLRQILGAMRGWQDAEWDAGVARLQERGLLDAAGGPSEAGRELHARIERRTDELAAAPWAAAAAAGDELITTLGRLGGALQTAGIVPGVVVRAARLDE